MDAENNDQNSLPSKEQLSKLSLPKIQWYASRCALRALPYLVGPSIKVNWIQRNLEAICVAAMIGQCLAKQSTSIPRASVAAAARAAYADAAAAYYAATAYATAYAAARASAIDIYADDNILAATRANDAARAAADNAAYADYQLLSEKNYHIYPLWQNLSSPHNQQNFKQWFSLLETYNLQDVADIYQGLLQGSSDTVSKTQALLIKRAGFTQDDFLSDEVAHESNDKVKHATHTVEGATTNDFLGRKPLATAMARLLSNKDNTKSLIIGLFGEWGAGKSSLLNMLNQQLKRDARKDALTFKTNEFNAWSYEHTDNIQAGVAQEAIKGLTGGLPWYKKIQAAWKLNWRTQKLKLFINIVILIGWVIFIVASLIKVNSIAADYINTLKNEIIFLLGSWSIGITALFFSAYHLFKPLLASTYAKEFLTYLNLPAHNKTLGQLPVYQAQVKELADICLKDNERFLFIVDDLDRCSTEGIIKVLEAVRLVMELDKVYVIIAIDHRIALATLAHHYQHIEDNNNNPNNLLGNKYSIARDYLGKIIHLPITLPKPQAEDISSYLSYLFTDLMDEKSIDDVNEEDSSDIPISSNQVLKNDIPDLEMSSQTDADKSAATLPMTPTPIEFNRIAHSQAEKDLFSKLCVSFKFTNPRQIKRLHNSYRLVLAFLDPKDSQKKHHLMMGLFVQEDINNQNISLINDASEAKEWLSDDKNSSKANALEGMDSETLGKSIFQVKDFVLPTSDYKVIQFNE